MSPLAARVTTLLFAACASALAAASAPQAGLADADPADSGAPAPLAGVLTTVPETGVRLAELDASAPLPADLVSPEGKSRWDLTGVVHGSAGRIRALVRSPDGGVAILGTGAGVDGAGDAGSAPVASLYEDPSGGDRARWIAGDGAPLTRSAAGIASLAPGSTASIDLVERRGEAADRLRVETRIVGIGWLHLPEGPRETVLERALVLREKDGESGYRPEKLMHRWIDPRAGVVAEVWGPPRPDGRSRLAIAGARVADGAPAAAVNLKIYVDEVESTPFDQVYYGWNRGPGTPISSLTPEGFTTIGNLVAASTWNFSGNTTSRARIVGTTTANNATTVTGSGTRFQRDVAPGDFISLSSAIDTLARVLTVTSDTQLTVQSPLGNGTTQNLFKRVEIAGTTTPITAAETCNVNQCGYTVPNGRLDRRDASFDRDSPGRVDKFNSVSQRENRPADVTIWLRAGAQAEGRSGSFGDGESRFCYVTHGGVTRSPVPQWRFSHQDASGWFMQTGDSWEGGPFLCEQNIFNQLCGAPQIFDRLYSQACGTHTGKQTGAVVKGGVVILPSGHTFNALLARTVTDFCVYIAASCAALFKVDEVRTVNYLWQVPRLGTVARLQSAQNVADATSFTTVEETDFKFGLFPPRSIAVTGATDTTVSLSWDPGLDTHRIGGYRVYWDTDSGAASPYAFDSLTHASQVGFSGTTAVISGLAPGTTYWFTVTSRSTYTDPSTGVPTTYESLLYPTQVSGDPNFIYPVEVQATTTGGTCIPTAEVLGLRLGKLPGGGIQFCWQPASDPCLVGYRVLGADAPSGAGSFTPVADTGLETCWSGDPSQRFFLVVARGTGGEGPWGHFGR